MELNFQKGTWLWVLQCNEDGWWQGVIVDDFEKEIDENQSGWFSSNFVLPYVEEGEGENVAVGYDEYYNETEEIAYYQENDEFYYNEYYEDNDDYNKNMHQQQVITDQQQQQQNDRHNIVNHDQFDPFNHTDNNDNGDDDDDVEWWHDSKHVFDSIRNADTDWIRWLLGDEGGHSVNCLDDNGNTPLMCAAACGSKKIVKMLLRRGADVDRRNHDGQSVLDICFLNGHKRLLKYLHKKINGT